ncbi:MAG: LPS export ABC transporter periplasmic protein LptC [Pseudomonadota bacterium]
MRRLLLLVVALAISVALWMGVQSFDRASEPQAQDESGPRPQYALRDAEWTRLGADGKTQFHITAATIDYYENKSAVIGRMSMDGLGGDKGAWTLTSPAGEVPADQERILMKKPVVITGKPNKGGDSILLVTDQLWVDSKRKEIYTSAPLRMTYGPQQATATGMKADWAGENLNLLHDVKVTYVPRS